jgi:hypothetical protein
VKPAAALNHLEEVLVITKKAQREAEVASSTPMRAADILAQRLPSVPDQPASTEGAAGSSGSGTSAMQTKPAANAAAPATQTPKTASAQAGTKPVVSSTPGGVAGTKPVVSSAPGGAAGTKPMVSSTPGVAAIKPVVSSTSVAVQNSAAASAPHQATHVAGQPGTPTSAGTAQAQKNQVGSAVVMKPTTTSTAVTGTAPIKTEAAKKAQAVPVGTKTPNAAVPVKVPAQGAAPSTTPGTNTLQQPKPKPAGAATKPATAPPQSQAAPKIQSDSGGTPQ